MRVIERFFSSPDRLLRVGRDFSNLIGIVERSHGELSLQLRQDSFNVYYRGNSLAKVTLPVRADYTVEIHNKFVCGLTEDAWSMFDSRNDGTYSKWTIDGRDARRFLSTPNIRKLKANIDRENNGEEITFEQSLLTDNPPSRQLLVIDRQVEDHESPKPLDILALVRPTGEGAFKFLVIEVKLGKNRDLRGKVADQLNYYVDHIRGNINDYVACYRQNYAQKYQLGLMKFDGAESSIEIEPFVEGVVVVGGYSGIAGKYVKELKSKHPEIRVLQMRNSLVIESSK